jgi:hypothetical protein
LIENEVRSSVSPEKLIETLHREIYSIKLFSPKSCVNWKAGLVHLGVVAGLWGGYVALLSMLSKKITQHFNIAPSLAPVVLPLGRSAIAGVGLGTGIAIYDLGCKKRPISDSPKVKEAIECIKRGFVDEDEVEKAIEEFYKGKTLNLWSAETHGEIWALFDSGRLTPE